MLLATLIADPIAKIVSSARRGQEADAMSARDLADIAIDSQFVGHSQLMSSRPPARW
jgi:hypothetical protein